jgi:HD-GYP domain-containing protein (c-di-GMP phosphodiesterase class II)
MHARVKPPKSEDSKSSPLRLAKALAVTLREEFGVPFTFHHPSTGAEIGAGAGMNGTATTGTSGVPADWSALERVALEQGTAVTGLPNGRYRLILCVYESHEPIFIATGVIEGVATTLEAAHRELGMLEKWLRAVSDRWRLSDQHFAGPKKDPSQTLQRNPHTPWEALLALGHVTRRVRFDKDPHKNLQRILDAGIGLVGASALVWAPRDRDQPVLTQGETCLGAEDWRQLASLLTKNENPRDGRPVLWDKFQERPGAGRFPHIDNLLALPVSDRELLGWVIAINKKGASGAAPAHGPLTPTAERSVMEPRGFPMSDAALLTSFAALLGLHERGCARYQALKDLLVGLTRSLTTAIDAKDSYTYGHSERVARIAVELGRDLGMDGNELGDLYLAGLLHDVGKIGVRDEVLGKPGKLTPEEQVHLRQHVTIGYTILADLRQIRNLLPGVLYHHERYDGGGYPDGLAGENIPLMARVLALADSYDAMTTARPYRDPMPLAQVEQIINDGAGSQWDKRVVEAFQRCRHRIHAIRQRGVGESLRHAIDGAIRTDSDTLGPPGPGSVTSAAINHAPLNHAPPNHASSGAPASLELGMFSREIT